MMGARGPGNRIRSFGFAFQGILHAIRTQANFRIHLVAMVVVIALGLVLHVSPGEWCILVLTFLLVLSMEIVNTAIENLTDLVSPGYHEKAGRIKDLAAGAVLVSAIGAVVVGLVIFLPKLL